MKQYPLRYPDKLEESIDYIGKLQNYGTSKNKVIQNCIIIAAASVKKLMRGHAKLEDFEKRKLVQTELKVTLE